MQEIQWVIWVMCGHTLHIAWNWHGLDRLTYGEKRIIITYNVQSGHDEEESGNEKDEEEEEEMHGIRKVSTIRQSHAVFIVSQTRSPPCRPCLHHLCLYCCRCLPILQCGTTTWNEDKIRTTRIDLCSTEWIRRWSHSIGGNERNGLEKEKEAYV